MDNFPHLDVFCQIVDNYGDAGFSYRFARTYKRRHPQAIVRLFADKPSALDQLRINADGIEIYPFTYNPEKLAALVVETFGCQLPENYADRIKKESHLWINIEYLSAENWTANCHGKESPQGIPGLKKFFYMPGFTPGTGGILTDLQAPAVPQNTNNVSIFTYEQDFSGLLDALPPSQLLVFDKYSQNILSLQKNNYPQHKFSMEKMVDQDSYDNILTTSKLNLVRGEESLIRAILAGKPFLWQAYKQEHNYQLVKTAAFLEIFKPYFTDPAIFSVYAKLTQAWNGDFTAFAVDNWRFFLENLPAVESYTQAFGKYLRQSCDLGRSFDQFIKQNW